MREKAAAGISPSPRAGLFAYVRPAVVFLHNFPAGAVYGDTINLLLAITAYLLYNDRQSKQHIVPSRVGGGIGPMMPQQPSKRKRC